jgi:hypothetical protein
MTRLTTVARGAVLGTIALFAGCSGTPPGDFIILQNQALNSDCSVPATPGAVYRGEGVLDVRLIGDTGGYELFPLLQNNFPPPSGGQTTDANRIALSGFDVDVEVEPDAPPSPIKDLITNFRSLDASPDNQALVQYSTLTSGSVSSGGGNTASGVNVFPAPLAKMIRDMAVLSPTNTYWVTATVRARGDTLVGGVRSDAFKYPIQLCDGCLIFNQGTCPVMAAMGNACDPGQDDGTGCCTLSGSLVCPALVAAK